MAEEKNRPAIPIVPGWYTITDPHASKLFRMAKEGVIEVIDVREIERDVLYQSGYLRARMGIVEFSKAVAVGNPGAVLSDLLRSASDAKCMPRQEFARNLMASEDPEIADLAERVAARQQAEADDLIFQFG